VKHGSMSRDRTWALRWAYFFLTIFAIFSLVPPILHADHLAQGRRGDCGGDQSVVGGFIRRLPTTANCWGRASIMRFFLNSAMVSIFVVTLTMLISVPAAFALSRMRFLGLRRRSPTGVFLTYLIPDTLLFLPLFKMFRDVPRLGTGIELINHWYVLLVIYPTLTVPFCTWIMIGYFASIPKELDEGAIIDGASWFPDPDPDLIPVALPGISQLPSSPSPRPGRNSSIRWCSRTSTDQLVLPVGIITTLIKGDVFNWGQIMTGALLGAAPPLIIYAFLMDYYIAGADRRRDKGLNSWLT